MVVSYECVLERCDNQWSARFPQVPDVVVSASTRDEALHAATEALRSLACDSVNNGKTLARADHMAEVALVSVQVTSEDVELSRCMTMADAARELGVGQSRVSHLAAGGVLEAVNVAGRRLVTIASVKRYATERRSPGRPPLRSRAPQGTDTTTAV